ncbi:cysteine desulfurase [Coxiella endosymbiont of Amblyomma americanum]|uniref:cysteine desulfurase n=1 Tax=Coxiella endosymbiont of Amblyomma americanum TaxID=325775 RepID=UPI0005803C5D|nr:cysteine desulfurase [Coxiella endosymbiont of Amblyomma americanum]AJC50527.1 cysteine sulfinate desulfinase [Coxiella endosymbiont of Amblyomma americanum]AUJ58862.1 aminotransferase [Coxiella-like endosymbiont of Amblyomma americanum]
MISTLNSLRDDFPILKEKILGKPLVYLDSGATTQKPQAVISAISHYYHHDNANVHRGIYTISERATVAYESARRKVKMFINAAHLHEIIFTHGTTESINLIATSFGKLQIQQGDEIVISEMEHHSNIVPWQLLCERVGAKLKIIPVNDDGTLNLYEYQGLLTERTKIVGIIHASNVLGTINAVKKIICLAHQKNIPVLLDGAQAIAHMVIDVQDLDCDFYVFSGHKLYGPTGIGVLYGKRKWLEKMPPYQGGGNMIRQVTFEKTEYSPLPHKFEAGTPNIAGVIGLGAAIDYLSEIGFERIDTYEQALLDYATKKLWRIHGLKIIGDAQKKIGIISFVIEKIHPHDIATILDNEGIAIRSGHHCAMPLMERFKLPATARITLALYNTFNDIDRLTDGLTKVNQIFKNAVF